MSNVDNSAHQAVNPDYRASAYQLSLPPPQQALGQPYQQLQRLSLTLPQQQLQYQVPQGYYNPEQYQQYQQVLGLLSQLAASQQPYPYYMPPYNNHQQGVPPPAQLLQPTQQQLLLDQYAHARYPAGNLQYGAAPYSNYLVYQPQAQQLSQPQPLYGAASGAGGAGAAAASTPVQQDTLNAQSSLLVGQLQPPGIRPRVTTTMWEDEKTLCYQVDANNVLVVRRADNNMINGTKLLNVAQMTRGRRDGILKLEKVRHVVKIGSMHLKGVWVPFERALAMAQREGIVDLLYPLFVRDIKRVIQTGVTPALNAAAVSALPAAVPHKNPTPQPHLAQNGGGQPNPAKALSMNYYQLQYGLQALGLASNADQLPGNATSTAISTDSSLQQGLGPQQAQLQMYGYQQPYYAGAPNPYYQQYGQSGSYSQYQQPMYLGYGSLNPQVQGPQAQLQLAQLGQGLQLAQTQPAPLGLHPDAAAAAADTSASADVLAKPEEKK